MKAWTKAHVASVVRDRQTDCSWHSRKKPAWQTDEMCLAIVSWPSKMTPRSFAVDIVSTVEDDVVVTRGSWETVSLASWCCDPSQSSSVFSAFQCSTSNRSAPCNDQVAWYIRPNGLRLPDSTTLRTHSESVFHLLTPLLLIS